MKRLILVIMVAGLLVAGCDSTDTSTVPPTSSQPPPLLSQGEMEGLRAQVEAAADSVVKAKAIYDKECPPNWRSEDSVLCERMKAQGGLVRAMWDAENNCSELVEKYNAQVRRGAPNNGGEIVLGTTVDSAGKVISCDA